MQHDRQPDYGNWPHDEDNDIFERKRSRLEQIQWDYDAGGYISERDMTYIMSKNKHFWCLLHFFTNERVRMETELFAKGMEIEDLKRQLEEKNAG